MREAAAHGPGAVEIGGHQRAALAHKADGLGGQRVDLQDRRRAQHQLIGRADHTQAVGPDHAHAVTRADVQQLALACKPGLARIREARRNHQRATAAQAPGLLDLRQHLVGGHSEHDQIRALVELLQRGVSLHAEQLFARRIDGQHLARIAMLEQHAKQASAKFRLIFRSPHQRDRGGVQQLRYRCLGCSVFFHHG
ncbi:hypothetical protein SDC9_98318 [bioreactor metagenome]|uniref:Uncharacterized protein n=1 Tax=bioreactor metagenome TaxID=1076179 RepID=A0A645AEF8_9ZZZZ